MNLWTCRPLLVLLLLLAAVAQHGRASAALDASSAHGVQHFSLPVHLPNCTGVLYGFAKCLRAGDQLRWRVIAGLLHTRRAPDEVNFNVRLNQFTFAACGGAPPPLVLSAARQSFPLRRHALSGAEWNPLAWEGETPAAIAASDSGGAAAAEAAAGGDASSEQGATGGVRLHTAMSDYSWMLHASCGAAPDVGKLRAFPERNYVLLSRPISGRADLRLWAAVLAAGIEWHAAIGFTGYIAYGYAHQIAYLERRLAPQIADGRLVPVIWRATPAVHRMPGSPEMLHIAHGYLMGWGQPGGWGLQAGDLDEFVVLRKGVTIRDVWSACAAGGAAVAWWRTGAFCSGKCEGPALSGRLELWSRGAAAVRRHGTVTPLGSRNSELNHLKTWSTGDCGWPASLHWVALAPGCEPPPGGARVPKVERPGRLGVCGLMLHVVNFWKPRMNPRHLKTPLCKLDFDTLALSDTPGSNHSCKAVTAQP